MPWLVHMRRVHLVSATATLAIMACGCPSAPAGGEGAARDAFVPLTETGLVLEQGQSTGDGSVPSDGPLVALDSGACGPVSCPTPGECRFGRCVGVRVTHAPALMVTEAGSRVSVSVSLVSAPTAQVTVTMQSSDLSEGRISPSSLVFHPDDWATAQKFAILGRNDEDDDGDQTFKVVVNPTTSMDPAYAGLDPADVKVVNQDNERGAHQLVMTPAHGSDIISLFSSPTQWQLSRAKLNQFRFYEGHLLCGNVASCPWYYGANIFPAFVTAQAFKKLAQWNIDVSVDIGAIKSYACTGALAAKNTILALDNVASTGYHVRYVVMDEPYIGGTEGCGLGLQQVASETADYILRVKQAHPEVIIGDMGAYPFHSVAELEAWISALEDRGVQLPFFDLDVDRILASAVGANVAADLKQFKTFCDQRGIRVGVLFWGEEVSSDAAWYLDALAWVAQVKAAIGLPHISYMQSWQWDAAKNPVPHNLPESNPYTLTHLVNEGWGLLVDNNASFVNQIVPGAMKAGQTYPVSVSMTNTGPLPWHAETLYALGSQSPPDNQIWGLGRVAVTGEVKPGATQVFSFSAKAPASAGSYQFQWRMVQEGTEWFGAITPKVTVTVTP